MHFIFDQGTRSVFRNSSSHNHSKHSCHCIEAVTHGKTECMPMLTCPCFLVTSLPEPPLATEVVFYDTLACSALQLLRRGQQSSLTRKSPCCELLRRISRPNRIRTSRMATQYASWQDP